MSAQNDPTVITPGVDREPDEPVVAVAAPPRPRTLWRDRDFMTYWAGETVSLFGTQVTSLALPLTAVALLDIGAEQLGTLRFLQFISFLVLPLPFGMLADRVRRRPLMVGANAVRAAVIGVVPTMVFLGGLHLGVLYAVSLIVGVCTVLFDVCWMSYVPTLVRDKERLVEANGKIGMSYSAAEVAGPGVAGGLVQALTAPYALVIDAFSYLASVVSLLAIRVREAEPERPANGTPRPAILVELAAGLRFVLAHRHLRVIAALGSLYNFFFMFMEAVFLLFAVRTLGFSAGVLGLVLSAGAVGGLLGAGSAGRIIDAFPLGRAYQVAVLVGFASALLIPAAGMAASSLAQVVVVGAGFFVMNLGVGVANVIAISLRQTITPTRLMARMNAAMRTLMYGLGSLGALVGGFVGAAVGLHQALWVAAVGSALSSTPLLVSSIPRLRTLPAPADDPNAKE
jgi:MFS family permease